MADAPWRWFVLGIYCPGQMPAANKYRQSTQGDRQMSKLWTGTRIALCVCLGMLLGDTGLFGEKVEF
jgi:hypothetical protein